MAKYLYSARDQSGAVQSGSLEANTEDEVINRLQGRGLLVTTVEPMRATGESSGRKVIGGISKRKMHTAVKLDDQVLLCQQLETLLEAGVPLLRSLEVVLSQVESRKLLTALTEVKQDVEAGSSFHAAMEKHPLVFNSLWVNLVETGEASGHLAETLKQLAKQLASAQHLQNQARTALTYPIFLMVAAVGVIAMFVYWLIPKFASMFKSMDMELPMITKIVIGASNFARDYVFLIVGGTVAFFFLFKKYLGTEAGKKAKDRFLLTVPAFSTLFMYIQLAEFSRGLSTMLESGVPLLTGLRILANSSSNKIYGKAIDEIRDSVKEGKTLAEPMAEVGLFPPIAVQMVQVGEEVGELAGVVARLAQYYEERVETAIERMTRLFEPIAIVLMAGIVLIIVLSIFMPIFKMATLTNMG